MNEKTSGRNIANILLGVLTVIGLSQPAVLSAPQLTPAKKPVSDKACEISPETRQQLEHIAALEPKSWTPADEKFVVDFSGAHPRVSLGHALLSSVLKNSGYEVLSCDEADEAWRLNRDEPKLLSSAIKMRFDRGYEEAGLALAAEGAEYYRNNYDMLLRLIVMLQVVEKQPLMALKLIDLAEKLKPGRPELLLIQVNSLLDAKLFDEAEEPARQLAALSRTRALGLQACGKIWHHRGNNAKAEKYFREAYELANSDPAISSNFFEILTETGKHVEALEPGLLALAVYTGGTEAKQMKKIIVSHLRRSDLHRLAKTTQLVAQRLHTAKELSYLFFSVGDIADNLGGIHHAIAYYQIGLKANPTYGRAYMRLARDLERSGESFETVTFLYAQAAQLAPKDREVQLALARNESRGKSSSNDLAYRIKSSIRVVCAPEVASTGTSVSALP